MEPIRRPSKIYEKLYTATYIYNNFFFEEDYVDITHLRYTIYYVSEEINLDIYILSRRFLS